MQCTRAPSNQRGPRESIYLISKLSYLRNETSDEQLPSADPCRGEARSRQNSTNPKICGPFVTIVRLLYEVFFKWRARPNGPPGTLLTGPERLIDLAILSAWHLKSCRLFAQEKSSQTNIINFQNFQMLLFRLQSRHLFNLLHCFLFFITQPNIQNLSVDVFYFSRKNNALD